MKPENHEKWQAVLHCDESFDGRFYYGVKTTGGLRLRFASPANAAGRICPHTILNTSCSSSQGPLRHRFCGR